MQKKIALLRSQEIPRKNSVGHADSVEKILGQISFLTPDVIEYRATTRTGRERVRRLDAPVREVILSPSVFRKFVCTPGCTACCQKFTLDYIPQEFKSVRDQTGFSKRTVQVNGREYQVFTNDQNQNPICDFLTVERPDGGLGCAHYPFAPLSCISAPQLQFIQMRPERTYVLKKPFGRAWAMTPTPQCQFLEVEIRECDLDTNIAILERFLLWARYFRVETCLPHLIRMIAQVQRIGLVPALGITIARY